MIEALLDDPPPRPGAERTHGDIHLYNRDKYGDWTVERKYGEEQTQQSEAYRDYRRRKNDWESYTFGALIPAQQEAGSKFRATSNYFLEIFSR